MRCSKFYELALLFIFQRQSTFAGLLVERGQVVTCARHHLHHMVEGDAVSTAVPLLVGEVVRGEYGGICGHANPTINDIANHHFSFIFRTFAPIIRIV